MICPPPARDVSTSELAFLRVTTSATDLPPSGWSKIYVILDTEGKDC